MDEDLVGWMRWLSPVEEASAVWAGYHAETATDASVIVCQNYAVFVVVGGSHRTHFDAGGVLTVHAWRRLEKGVSVSRGITVDYLDPFLRTFIAWVSSIMIAGFSPSRRNTVLSDTCLSALSTSIAQVLVYDHDPFSFVTRRGLGIGVGKGKLSA